MSIDKLLNN